MGEIDVEGNINKFLKVSSLINRAIAGNNIRRGWRFIIRLQSRCWDMVMNRRHVLLDRKINVDAEGRPRRRMEDTSEPSYLSKNRSGVHLGFGKKTVWTSIRTSDWPDERWNKKSWNSSCVFRTLLRKHWSASWPSPKWAYTDASSRAFVIHPFYKFPPFSPILRCWFYWKLVLLSVLSVYQQTGSLRFSIR